jgi:hypothetical protein
MMESYRDENRSETRREIWARGLTWLALLVSLVGFLGYYNTEGFVSSPPTVVLGLQLIALGGAALLLRTRIFVNFRGVVPLVLIAIWAAVTLLWADDPITGLRRWLLVFVPGILLCALAARDPRPQQTFLWFTALVVAITLASTAFTAIVLFFHDFDTGGVTALARLLINLDGWSIGTALGGRPFQFMDTRIYIPRFSGLTSNPNSMGLFAAIALISLCGIVKPRRNILGAATILIVGIVAMLVLASVSRAAIAMTLTGIFIVILMRTNRPGATRACAIIVIGLSLALYLVTWITGGSPNPGTNEIIELRERAHVWLIAMQFIGNIWTSGLGFGLTQEAVYGPLGLETAAHSVPLSMLLETGIVGLVLVLACWFHPVFRTTSQGRNFSATEIAVVALLIALFVHQTVDSSVFRYHWAHFVFVYLLGASAGLAGPRTSE